MKASFSPVTNRISTPPHGSIGPDLGTWLVGASCESGKALVQGLATFAPLNHTSSTSNSGSKFLPTWDYEQKPP